MNSNHYQTAIIKIGTDVITTKEGLLNQDVIASIVKQVYLIRKHIPRVGIVTSGAVAAGRAEYGVKKRDDESLPRKQMFASAGQHPLMASYADRFKEHGMVANQILVTGKDIDSLRSRGHITDTLEEIFASEIPSVPVINENDTVATRELKISDNDELARHVALMTKAQKVILLTSVAGVLRDYPNPESVIREVPLGSEEYKQYLNGATSGNGRGGMKSKTNVAEKLARKKIETTIAPGREVDVIKRILLNRERIGTTFLTK